MVVYVEPLGKVSASIPDNFSGSKCRNSSGVGPNDVVSSFMPKALLSGQLDHYRTLADPMYIIHAFETISCTSIYRCIYRYSYTYIYIQNIHTYLHTYIIVHTLHTY